MLRTPQHGFDPNERDPSPSSSSSTGMTALHYASAAGKLELIIELMVQGADISLTDHLGNTCLHYAAKNYHRCAVEILLRYGADPSIPNKEGLVAVEMVMGGGNGKSNNPELVAGITELFMRDKGNIFSPVVHAKNLFSEYLQTQHQQQNQQGKLPVERLQEGEEDGGGGGEGDGGDAIHVNLEEDFNQLSIK